MVVDVSEGEAPLRSESGTVRQQPKGLENVGSKIIVSLKQIGSLSEGEAPLRSKSGSIHQQPRGIKSVRSEVVGRRNDGGSAVAGDRTSKLGDVLSFE